MQNFIELSAAVHELSRVQKKNSDENITVRRYRADSNNVMEGWKQATMDSAPLKAAVTFTVALAPCYCTNEINQSINQSIKRSMNNVMETSEHGRCATIDD